MSAPESNVPTTPTVQNAPRAYSPRLRDTFARLAAEGRKAFIPYITAGDPDLATTALIMDALAEGGASVIELGVPFSDPMADGEVIQAAMLRALAAGTKFKNVLDLVRAFRARHTTPVVLFGYLNPLFRHGLENAARDAAEAGADAFLVVDLPPEEAPQLTDHLRARELDFVALFTPTSSDERVRAIAAQASGFAYYVSMAGITGARPGRPRGRARGCARLRAPLSRGPRPEDLGPAAEPRGDLSGNQEPRKPGKYSCFHGFLLS